MSKIEQGEIKAPENFRLPQVRTSHRFRLEGVRYQLKWSRKHQRWFVNFRVKRMRISARFWESSNPSVDSIKVNGYTWNWSSLRTRGVPHGWVLDSQRGLPRSLPPQVAVVIETALQRLQPHLLKVRSDYEANQRKLRDQEIERLKREESANRKHYGRVLKRLG